jgi:hypothetical protein
VAFESEAEAAFRQVREALDATGVNIGAVNYSEFNADGSLAYASFGIHAGDFDRFAYIYDPGGALPESFPHEFEYTRINPDWYFEWEDWN